MKSLSIEQIFLIFYFGFLSVIFQSCTSANVPDNFPSPDDYPGYSLVDARHVDNIVLDVNHASNLAIVVRNLNITAFTNIETPRYKPSEVKFLGVSQCCNPDIRLIGATPLMVYKFQFIKKGTTTIQLIARHKGLNMAVSSLPSDLVTTITVNVK